MMEFYNELKDMALKLESDNIDGWNKVILLMYQSVMNYFVASLTLLKTHLMAQ